MNVDVKLGPTSGPVPMLTEPPVIEQIGIIGAGQMGNGIAHVCALAGMPVVMVDIRADALGKAIATMARNMDRQVNRSIISSDDRDAALARVTTSTDYAAFADADLVIEAATEKEVTVGTAASAGVVRIPIPISAQTTATSRRGLKHWMRGGVS